MNDPGFIMVRLRRDTAYRLRQFCYRTLKLVKSGRVDAEVHPIKGHLTLDMGLRILLDREDKHRERGRKPHEPESD